MILGFFLEIICRVDLSFSICCIAATISTRNVFIWFWTHCNVYQHDIVVRCTRDVRLNERVQCHMVKKCMYTRMFVTHITVYKHANEIHSQMLNSAIWDICQWRLFVAPILRFISFTTLPYIYMIVFDTTEFCSVLVFEFQIFEIYIYRFTYMIYHIHFSSK